MSESKGRKKMNVSLSEIMEAEMKPNDRLKSVLFEGSVDLKETELSKKKAYMAGKLFNDADRTQREKEYSLLAEANKKHNIEMEVFSPIYAPINDKSTMPTSLDIFNGDELPLMSSDVIFADMSDFDPGVMMEIGMVIHKDVKLYAYLSDIRITNAGDYEGIHVPFGSNQFVVGGIEKYFEKIYPSFNEALKAYIRNHS